MKDLKKYYNETIKKQLMSKHNYGNVMQVPKLLKIVISRGMGEATSNSKVIEVSLQTLTAITGQKPLSTKSKKSISNFKLKENQVIGALVTLRGKKMFDFLTKFVNLALPKIRDFQGIATKGFDGRGNYSLGIKEELIFPEINYDALDKIRGFNITFVTSAKTDQESYDLLKAFGMPFKKEKVKGKIEQL
jgi:large subunit ribosomal protein L5